MTIKNTGTVVEMTLNRKSNNPSISGGPLNPGEDYYYIKLVIHWGRWDNNGSDHAVNNIK